MKNSNFKREDYGFEYERYSDLDIRDLMRFFVHKKESTFKRYIQVQKPIDSSKIIDIYGFNSILKKVS